MRLAALANVISRQKRRPDGFALVSVTMMIAAVIAFNYAVVEYSLAARRASRVYETDILAMQIAEAGVKRAILCLNATAPGNCGSQYGDYYTGETNVAFGTGRMTVVVSGTAHRRAIISTGYTANGHEATIRVRAMDQSDSSAAGFDYPLQVGDGGVTVGNNALVDGSGSPEGGAYSESDIICSNNGELRGALFVARTDGLILNCELAGDAHADNVVDNDMNGHDIYYRLTQEDNKHVGTVHAGQPTPVMRGMPAIDVPYWQREAARGGILFGDQSPDDGDALGPVKIQGDLRLDNNVEVTVNGPIWVTGQVRMDNNSAFALNPSFGPTGSVIVVDGKFTLSNNSQIYGSGDRSSFLTVVSSDTSIDDSDPAIHISNNAGGALFLALYGGIVLDNNATVTALAARRVVMKNSTDIVYKSTYHDPTGAVLANEPDGYWRISGGEWRQD